MVAVTYDVPQDADEEVICAVNNLGKQRRNFGEALQLVRDLKKSRGYCDVQDGPDDREERRQARAPA